LSADLGAFRPLAAYCTPASGPCDPHYQRVVALVAGEVRSLAQRTSTAAREQLIGISGINVAVTRLDVATQQAERGAATGVTEFFNG